MKLIPYGIGNFEEIIRDNYYFVDHTNFLHKLETYKTPVFLRPRRFGKSLRCSLLECYYDINRKDKFKELFGNLEIGKNPTGNQNKYMVLRFNFSQIQISTKIEEIENNFNSLVFSDVNKHISYYQKYYKGLKLEKNNHANEIFKKIKDFVNTHKLPPIYLIIDEYDNFTNQLVTNYHDKLYKDVTDKGSWLQTFYKVIKAGVEELSIGKVYITGVLPITMDDLTSGFNIAQYITLNPRIAEMLGFTQSEVDKLLEEIFENNNYDQKNIQIVKDTIKTNYNGYRFVLEQENLLYNSTLLNFFLSSFIDNNGNIPESLIDDNIRTDLKWIQRITVNTKNTTELINNIININELSYSNSIIKEKFNIKYFFEKDHYPLSFFYLGLLTRKNKFVMQSPNLTMKEIFIGYFNEIYKIDVSTKYTNMFQGYMDNGDFVALVKGYRELYISQIPAQAFDKANENFFRTTFYSLINMFLSDLFVFGVEYQVNSGRIDFLMIGKYDNVYKNQIKIVEFKYWNLKEGKKEKILKIESPQQGDIDQINMYAKDISEGIYAGYKQEKYIIYVVSNKGYVTFKID